MLSAVREHAPAALTVLDVGAYEPYVISQLDWIPVKVATDMQFNENQRAVWERARGVAFIRGDFLQLDFGATVFDVVLCSQVVEHLPHPLVEKFVKKMMRLARLLIVSTTLDVASGTIDGHVQDPLSEAEFRSWFNGSGEIVDFHRMLGGNPRANGTLPNALLKKRVPVWNQLVVWRRAP